MADKPTGLGEFATVNSTDANGQPTRIDPIAAKQLSGFTFGEHPAYNLLNKLLFDNYEWNSYVNTELNAKIHKADGNGVGLVPDDPSEYMILAIETGTSNYLFGFGSRATNPVTSVINSTTLTVGAQSGDSIAISGSAPSAVSVICISWT